MSKNIYKIGQSEIKKEKCNSSIEIIKIFQYTNFDNLFCGNAINKCLQELKLEN